MAAQILVFQSKCNVLFMMSDFGCVLIYVCIYTFLYGCEHICECVFEYVCLCRHVYLSV